MLKMLEKVKSLDYDKLVMNIETNGSLPAEDAVAYAARIFQDQLSLFVNFDEPAEIEKTTNYRT